MRTDRNPKLVMSGPQSVPHRKPRQLIEHNVVDSVCLQKTDLADGYTERESAWAAGPFHHSLHPALHSTQAEGQLLTNGGIRQTLPHEAQNLDVDFVRAGVRVCRRLLRFAFPL
jgi:hypothetical protein